MTSSTGYSTTGSSAGPVSAAGADDGKGYWDIGQLKKAYSDYLNIKQAEIEEAKEARRYYHGAQWTEEQRAIFKRRKQDPATINRIARKIDGFVGAIEKLRQDPKAYPRNPTDGDAADLATACVREVLDQNEWQPTSSEAARDGGIEGISGVVLTLKKSKNPDPNDHDIGFEIVEPDSFFYDPRSYRPDFADAEYMGEGKWMSTGRTKRLFPDKAEEIAASVDGDGADLTSHPDRDHRWFSSDRKFIRVVECWYQHDDGEWCYAIFTGSTILMEGRSYFFDEDDKTICKYIMYSGNVDHDGDRYGFVRNMKSIQDGINFKESKLHHIMGSNRLIMTQGAVDDVEKARIEWSRPDGVIVKNPGAEIEADDRSFDFSGFFKLLEESKSEIENFGVNPAVIGEGVEKQSGRAISLLQQAGIAELGPYIIAYRGWKIRLYRAIFNNVKKYWTAEDYVRITDDPQIQTIPINKLGINPQNGLPTIINPIGELDVDIIMDEGPDSINMMADTYDALIALAQNGAQVPPQVLLELAPGIDSRTKKKITDMLAQQAQQPNPEVQKAQQMAQIKAQEVQADQQLKQQQAASDAQLERDKAALELQMKQAEIEAEAVAAERKSARDAETARQKAAMEIQLKREIAAAEIQLEREKAAAQFGIEQQRSAEQMALERDRAGSQVEIERFKTQESANNERTKIASAQEAKREADEPKKKADDKIEALSKTLEQLLKQMSMPKKLIRDAEGKIIGAATTKELT